MQKSNWSFYAQVLSRALSELETACQADPQSSEFQYYRNEVPVVLEEAREALSALKKEMQALHVEKNAGAPDETRH